MALKRSVFHRDDGHCVKCGEAAFLAHVHHRRPRMMGGGNARETWINSLPNLLLLHPHCHTWIERNREESLAAGWLVPIHTDPADVLVRYWDGMMYELRGDFRTPAGTAPQATLDWRALMHATLAARGV